MRRPTYLTALAFAALSVAVPSLTGCGASSTDATTPTLASSTSAQTSDLPATGQGAHTSDASGSAPATKSRPGPVNDSLPARARKAQIPASSLPGFNRQWTWRKLSAGPGPATQQASVCLQASMTAIGATAEYRTEFTSVLDEHSAATQTTAVFPDEHTAVTSAEVLSSWQKQCRAHASGQLGLSQVRMSELIATDTVVGPGRQWLVTYLPVRDNRDLSWFQAEGFVRDGDTVTYLVITTAGQDYNYAAGQEPMTLALGVAAQRLSDTR